MYKVKVKITYTEVEDDGKTYPHGYVPEEITYIELYVNCEYKDKDKAGRQALRYCIEEGLGRGEQTLYEVASIVPIDKPTNIFKTPDPTKKVQVVTKKRGKNGK